MNHEVVGCYGIGSGQQLHPVEVPSHPAVDGGGGVAGGVDLPVTSITCDAAHHLAANDHTEGLFLLGPAGSK